MTTGLDLDFDISVKPTNYGVNQISINYPTNGLVWSKVRVQRKFGEYPTDPYDGDNIYAADNTSDLSLTVTSVNNTGGIESISWGDPFNGGAVATSATSFTSLNTFTTSGSGTGAVFSVTKSNASSSIKILSSTATPISITSKGSNYAVGDTIRISGSYLGGTAYSSTTMVPDSQVTVVNKKAYLHIFDNGSTYTTSRSGHPTLDTGNRQGETAYYAVFAYATYDGSVISGTTPNETYWVRSSLQSCRFVKDNGTLDFMLKSLPAIYTKDAKGDLNTDLQQFLSLFAFQYDVYRSSIDAVYNLSDAANIDETLLKQSLSQYGVDFNDIPRVKKAKELLATIVKYQDERGSWKGIKDFIKFYTGYSSNIVNTKNLLLSYEQSSQEDGNNVLQPVPYLPNDLSLNADGTFTALPINTSFATTSFGRAVNFSPRGFPENFTKTTYILKPADVAGVKSYHSSFRVVGNSTTGTQGAMRFSIRPLISYVAPALNTSDTFDQTTTVSKSTVTSAGLSPSDNTKVVVYTADRPALTIGSTAKLTGFTPTEYNITGTVADIGYNWSDASSTKSEKWYTYISGISSTSTTPSVLGTVENADYDYTNKTWLKGSYYVMAAPLPKAGMYVIDPSGAVVPGTKVVSVSDNGLIKLSKPLIKNLDAKKGTVTTTYPYGWNTLTFSTVGPDMASAATIMPKVEPGKTYTFSFYAKSPTAPGGTGATETNRCWAEIRFWGLDGKPIGSETSTADGATRGTSAQPSNTAWTRFTVTATVPAANATVGVIPAYAECAVLVGGNNGSATQNIFLDGFQLEESGSVTDYQEARNLTINLIADRVNEITNPSFETGTTGWTGVTRAALSQVAPTNALFGSNVLNAALSSMGTTATFQYRSPIIKIISAKTGVDSSNNYYYDVTTETDHGLSKNEYVNLLGLPLLNSLSTVDDVGWVSGTNLTDRTFRLVSVSANANVNFTRSSRVYKTRAGCPVVFNYNSTSSLSWANVKWDTATVHPDKSYTFSIYARAVSGTTDRYAVIPLIAGNGKGLSSDNHRYYTSDSTFPTFTNGLKITKLKYDVTTNRLLTLYTSNEHQLSVGDTIDVAGLTTANGVSVSSFNTINTATPYTIKSVTATSVTIEVTNSLLSSIPLSSIDIAVTAPSRPPIILKVIGVESATYPYGFTRVSTSADNLGTSAQVQLLIVRTNGSSATANIQFDGALFEAGDATLPYFDGSFDGVNSVTSTNVSTVKQNSIWEGTANASRSHYYNNYGLNYTNPNYGSPSSSTLGKIAALLSDETYFGNQYNAATDYYVDWKPVFMPNTTPNGTQTAYISSFAPYNSSTNFFTAQQSPLKTWGRLAAESYYRVNDYVSGTISRIKAFSLSSSYLGSGSYSAAPKVFIAYITDRTTGKSMNIKAGELVSISGIFGGAIGTYPNSINSSAPFEVYEASPYQGLTIINTGYTATTATIQRVAGGISTYTASTTCVITASSAHGLKTGDKIYITGGNSSLNIADDSPKAITYINSTQFSVAYTTAPNLTSPGSPVWYIHTERPTTETWTITRAEQSLTSSEWPFMYDIKFAPTLYGTGGLDKYYYGKYVPAMTNSTTVAPEFSTGGITANIPDYETPPNNTPS